MNVSQLKEPAAGDLAAVAPNLQLAHALGLSRRLTDDN
jgi:hypothetical protein